MYHGMTWNERYVKLSGDRLEVFKKKGDASASLVLQPVSQFAVSGTGECEKKHPMGLPAGTAFLVQVGKKKHFFFAMSDYEKRQWLSALEHNVVIGTWMLLWDVVEPVRPLASSSPNAEDAEKDNAMESAPTQPPTRALLSTPAGVHPVTVLFAFLRPDELTALFAFSSVHPIAPFHPSILVVAMQPREAMKRKRLARKTRRSRSAKSTRSTPRKTRPRWSAKSSCSPTRSSTAASRPRRPASCRRRASPL